MLSRKLGEQIRIGSDVIITVVAIERGKIRLGIIAPRSVPILRTELAIQQGANGDDGDSRKTA